MLYENLNPESRSVEVQSEISVSGTGVPTQKGAHMVTPPPPLLQFSADLPLIHHVLLKPTYEA